MERSRVSRYSKEFTLLLLGLYPRGMIRKREKRIYEVEVYLYWMTSTIVLVYNIYINDRSNFNNQ